MIVTAALALATGAFAGLALPSPINRSPAHRADSPTR